jgi:hypothetical protein
MGSDIHPASQEPDYDFDDDLPNEAELTASLGPAPAWAVHLHTCMHKTKRSVQRLGERSLERFAERDAKFENIHTELTELNGKLSTLITLFGGESEDGKGGKGLFGEVRRSMARIDKLEAERNLLWGAMVVASAVLTAIGALVTSLIDGIGHTH